MKTTQKQFNYFKERCEYWVKFLGINEWFISYELKKLDEDTMALAVRLITQRKAAISMNTVICDNLDWNKIALEEVLHILFANMSFYGGKYFNDDIICEEEHIIIHKLINVLIK